MKYFSMFSGIGGIVLDPFAGTGTTLAKGIQLNRQVVGIEGSEEYCKTAEQRIELELNNYQYKLAF